MAMMNKTTEFSFILKPSSIAGAGIGVFAAHDIAEETHLRLFGDKLSTEERVRTLAKTQIPKEFQSFCKDLGETMICPLDFGQIAHGWYLNHSRSPNAIKRRFDWYAARDIRKGEEILIDYNSLGEPDEYKESYY